MHSSKRLNVHLYVIPTCNLRCKHCYYDALPANSAINSLISNENMASIIMALCDTFEAFFDVEGGEFFLRHDIGRLFDLLPVEYLHRLTITTNGVTKIGVPSAKLRELDEFRVSVEGHTDELQRDIRGIGLDPVYRTCRRLMSDDVPITLRITLHRKNYQYVDTMINHFIEKGFTRFSLYEFQATGRGCLCETEYALDESNLETIIRQLLVGSWTRATAAVKLSLGTPRVPLIRSYSDQLVSSGYEVIDLPNAASLTVNYDGTMGVCPWLIGNDNFGVFEPDTFASDIVRLIEDKRLNHSCPHCSAIRIRN